MSKLQMYYHIISILWIIIISILDCPPTHFQCANGKGCIPKEWLNDKSPDCSDTSDEDGKYKVSYVLIGRKSKSVVFIKSVINYSVSLRQ